VIKTEAIAVRQARCLFHVKEWIDASPVAIVTAMFSRLAHIHPLCVALILTCSLTATAAEAASPSPVAQECNRIGHKLGSVSVRACMDRNLQDTGARSVRGQAILMKEYPPLRQRKPIGRVLLIGGTHGDEYAAVSIVFKWMQTLDQYHSGMFHWHVTPLLNPDGLLLHRPSVRLNAHGVDLNRNMPSPDWYNKTAAYWKSRGFDPRRYPGAAPLSEPETQWLFEEIRSFKPDAIISVHAPYGVLDFDGPPVGPSDIGYLHLKLIGVYPGSLGNFAGVQHEIPVITVELPHAGIMPTQQQISNMWRDLIKWLRHNIPKEKTIRAYASFDAITDRLIASSTPPKRHQHDRSKRAATAATSAPAVVRREAPAEAPSSVHINHQVIH